MRDRLTSGSRWLLLFATLWHLQSPPHAEASQEELKRLGVARGVVVLVTDDFSFVSTHVKSSELTFLVQASTAAHAKALRLMADKSQWLGTRVYVEYGSRIPLADNLADGALVDERRDGAFQAMESELMRVLHPRAMWIWGKRSGVKPVPVGADNWSHPYHGPDNNPQSTDAAARAPYLTQFLSEPWYVPMPQVTVAAGGRVFKAFGHIALKKREWPWLNTLVVLNGYNGTPIWKRKLRPNFMIHRSAMVATDNRLYLADDLTCKVLDAATGKQLDVLKIENAIDPDGVWKWMALDKGTMYVLAGPKEVADTVIRGERNVPGWPWSGLGKAYAGKYAWGFGRTLLAIRVRDKKVLWSQQYKRPIDSRALCLAAGRLFVYSDQAFLECREASSGKRLWRSDDKKLLAAIGQHDRAQTPIKGFASSAYAKANSEGVYFAGPQRRALVGVSAEDGRLMWSYPEGNFQLVLRPEGLYAMGRMQTSKLFDYRTGRIVADLECYRGNCTRATGTIDSIFTRGYRHTGTMRLDLEGREARRIPLMRPACQDGVIVSQGHLYWGPWMCDCNHSLVGTVCLAPAGPFDFFQSAKESDRLASTGRKKANTPAIGSTGWPAYRSSEARTAYADVRIDAPLKELWRVESTSKQEATAPVASQGIVLVADKSGKVHALDAATGTTKWQAFTGGALNFPPELRAGRAFAGSGDGNVYSWDAATGERLWQFRAAPLDRRINVHGRLLSTWPVAGGVLVRDGTVYAAAGIASYDGTHIYALDEATGEIRWQNNSSGHLVNKQQVTGVSVQGHMLFNKGRLYLAGGNVVSPAIYDASTGDCLNKLSNEWWERPKDAKKPFPQKAKGAMFKRSPRGRELFLVDGNVRVFDRLLYAPHDNGSSRYFRGHFLQASGDGVVIRATGNTVVRLAKKKDAKGKPLGIWQTADMQQPLALAVTKNAVLAAGLGAAPDSGQSKPELMILDRETGKNLGRYPLPSPPVSWGLAVDEQGRIIVTMRDGTTIAFAARS